MSFETKDSGVREEYASGMRRDTQAGKPDYTLIDAAFLKRWAELMVRGAEKYGRDNWRLANSQEELDRFKASALRHMYQWLQGDAEEDHAVAVAFNLAAAEYVKGRVQATPSPAPEGSWSKFVKTNFLHHPVGDGTGVCAECGQGLDSSLHWVVRNNA